MNHASDEAIAAKIARLSRRLALRAAGAAMGAVLVAGGQVQDEPVAKKKRKRKRRKTKPCEPPQGTCGNNCLPLDTATNCGACGNRCPDGETCQNGVCCAQPLCRGECRSECPPPAANFPFPRALGYGIKPNTFSQAQLDDHVRAAYDRWKAFYLVETARDEDGNRVFRVAFAKSGAGRDVTVSEGQGFGMIVVAIMAGHDDEARTIFDGFWRFRLAHPSTIDARLMDWRVPGGAGNDSAFDGDADIAYGLLLADAQWGSAGPIDYLGEALQVIAGIRESTIGPQSRLPLLGDWVDPNGAPYNQYTPRTSDFMAGHFRAFGRVTGDNAWGAVTAACQRTITTLQADFSAGTGLLPDFVQPISASDHSPRPASPGFLEGPHDGAYNYNAGRDPWRIATDALLNGDRTSAAQASLIANWAEAETNGAPRQLRSGYALDGTPLPGSDYFSTFFAAPIGVAAMTDPKLRDWLNAIYAAVYDVSENYYEDTVTLLCLLAMTGNFWDPTLP